MALVVTALIIVIFTGGLCEDVKGRWKRKVEGSLEIETVIILDEEYVANQRKLGHRTNQSLVDLMQLKWTGVQAEWGRDNVLGYSITISVKEIVIWESNPAWYTPSNILDNTLSSICKGAMQNNLWTNYDHIHLYTGRQGTDVAGKAYTGDICKAGRKCAVSTDTGVDEYVISAHELGHCMGMGHDGDVGCVKTPGIMGGKTAGWSSCSVAALKILVQESSSVCLQTNDVAKDPLFELAKIWPGMVYTADEICEFKFGNGFHLKGKMTSCSGGSCIYMGTNKTLQGVVFSYPTPTDGSYCGEEKVCSSQIVGSGYECITWNDTGLDTRSVVKSPGVWSEWQQMSECSRTCGTGVKYRQRFCRTSIALCEGDRYYTEECNTQPCADDSEDEASLIKQRAGETCKHWKDNNIYSVIGKGAANYLTTGRKYGNSGDSQCEVTCDTVKGYTSGGERHGIMPDGTPCTLGSLSSYEEVNNLPRKSGRHGRCVQGVCYCFGCDNSSQCASNDGCGKCGGDNSTCRIVEGVYDTVVASGKRDSIAVLPKKSYLIQFYFNYVSMQYHFLEITDEDTGAKLLKYQSYITDDPALIAGTYWFKKSTKQYLYAYGPTNQTLIVQLYNYIKGSNTGVSYAYSVKKDCNMPTEVSNGTIELTVPGDTGIGATATVICEVGFSPSKTIIECKPTESWEQAKCEAIGKPEVPTDIKAVDGLVTETSITIQWKPGYNGGAPQSFVARYSKEQSDTWKEVHIRSTNDTNMNITITGLESGTSYMIEIFALNEMGSSSSIKLTAETKRTKLPPGDMNGLVIGLSVAGAVVVCGCGCGCGAYFVLIRRRPKSMGKLRAKFNPPKSLQWSKAVYS